MVREVDNGVEFDVKVVPGASRTRLCGRLGDAVKVQVAAPPERGKANAALEKFVAKWFGVSARQVLVVAGESSPRKVIRVSGVDRRFAETLLGVLK
ncbi:MAG: YggU family protein [Phycisphaerae bacterium]|nr:YggU family protein [Phycisphaerae bacterium]